MCFYAPRIFSSTSEIEADCHRVLVHGQMRAVVLSVESFAQLRQTPAAPHYKRRPRQRRPGHSIAVLEDALYRESEMADDQYFHERATWSIHRR
jgi:hypothetical protein